MKCFLSPRLFYNESSLLYFLFFIGFSDKTVNMYALLNRPPAIAERHLRVWRANLLLSANVCCYVGKIDIVIKNRFYVTSHFTFLEFNYARGSKTRKKFTTKYNAKKNYSIKTRILIKYMD